MTGSGSALNCSAAGTGHIMTGASFKNSFSTFDSYPQADGLGVCPAFRTMDLVFAVLPDSNNKSESRYVIRPDAPLLGL